jgi:hypothetical protein
MFLSMSAIGQTTAEKPQSKIEQFSARSGALMEKRFIDVGTVGGVKVQTFILTDLVSASTISGVRFEYYAYASYGGDNKIAVLDSDEIDGLIKSINVLKSSVFPSTRDSYSEVVYSSRDGFQAGAYFSKNKWTAFLKLERYDSKSQVTMEPEDFDKLLALIQEAKSKFK